MFAPMRRLLNIGLAMTLLWVAVPYSPYVPVQPAAAYSRPAVAPSDISRYPSPDSHSRHRLDVMPPVPAARYDMKAVDLSQRELRGLDLTACGRQLWEYATFDTHTAWPASLPAGYDPRRIMKVGLNPGLGIRSLHRQGIDGRGVHAAFLDWALLVDHQEYRDRLLRYNEVGAVSEESEMHGAAVASLLAGKTLGVAPGVTLTYYGIEGADRLDLHAKAIHEILDRNAALPPAQRIKVIGMSKGAVPTLPGFAEFAAALARAEAAGVPVFTTDPERFYPGAGLQGLDRHPLADPDRPESYRPGVAWAEAFEAGPGPLPPGLLVPMDSRTVAAETGQSDYRFDRQSGLSWSVPWLTGLYALALQVRPDLTPERFFQSAYRTGTTISYQKDGRTYQLGPIANPPALIRALQRS